MPRRVGRANITARHSLITTAGPTYVSYQNSLRGRSDPLSGENYFDFEVHCKVSSQRHVAHLSWSMVLN